jgi:cyanophycinase
MIDLDAQGPGPIALVGSGEFLPQMLDVDQWLLADRPKRAAFLATAAGDEGPASVERWLNLGTAHFQAMNIEAIPVPVITAEDANNEAFVELVRNVGLIYLSGGHPSYLSNTLRGSLVWNAIVEAWQQGTAIAGCSAGAMSLTAEAPRIADGTQTPNPGLALLPHVAVIPHFDRIPQWDPGFTERALARQTPDITLIGIDEDTAVVGGPFAWTVMGRLTVTVFGIDGSTTYKPGDEFQL